VLNFYSPRLEVGKHGMTYELLDYIRRVYPRWTIEREHAIWTATTRPTRTSSHFIYERELEDLERSLRKAEGKDK
jgi:hypothetical protein